MIKEWKCVKGEMDNETWPRAQDKEWGMTHDWRPGTPSSYAVSLRHLHIGCCSFLIRAENTVPNAKYNRLLHYYVLLYTQWLSMLQTDTLFKTVNIFSKSNCKVQPFPIAR